MVLYHRTLEGPKPGATAANMIPIAILMVMWVAWYTAIFAYVIFFGLFVDLAIRQWKSRAPLSTWIHWLAWGLLVVALGYTGNRYGFGRAFDPAIAGSLRGTLLAELFTILMPVLAVVFGLMIFGVLGWLGV